MVLESFVKVNNKWLLESMVVGVSRSTKIDIAGPVQHVCKSLFGSLEILSNLGEI
jgi:hypothetical protein